MPNKFDQQGWESAREDAAHENAVAMRGEAASFILAIPNFPWSVVFYDTDGTELLRHEFPDEAAANRFSKMFSGLYVTRADHESALSEARAELQRETDLRHYAERRVTEWQEREGRLREALERLARDEGGVGRAYKGNDKLPGCEDFYGAYNKGIESSFQITSRIARAALSGDTAQERKA